MNKIKKYYVPSVKKMTFRRGKKAFTLIEVLVACTLLITFLSLMTNFMGSFNKTNNVNGIKNDMDIDLRKAIDRLEMEGLPAIKVIDGTTVINGKNYTTGATQLVFEAIIYDSNGDPLFDNNGYPLYDLVGLEITEDTTVKRIRTSGTTILHPWKLYFSLQPNASNLSSRKKLDHQALFNSLMPVDSNGIYITPPGVASHPVFTYFGVTGDSKNDSYNLTTVIKIVLWGEKDYGASDIITSKKETEIKLRNFMN